MPDLMTAEEIRSGAGLLTYVVRLKPHATFEQARAVRARMSECAVVFRRQFCLAAGCGTVSIYIKPVLRPRPPLLQRPLSRKNAPAATARGQPASPTKHQGKLDHRDCQRSYRERRQGRMTDQSSPCRFPSKISPALPLNAPEAAKATQAGYHDSMGRLHHLRTTGPLTTL